MNEIIFRYGVSLRVSAGGSCIILMVGVAGVSSSHVLRIVGTHLRQSDSWQGSFDEGVLVILIDRPNMACSLGDSATPFPITVNFL